MLAMPPEEMERIQKPESADKVEDIDLEYRQLEAVYFNVIKKLEFNRTI